MTDIATKNINNYLAPILIVVVGFFLVQSLREIQADIHVLKQSEIDRREWVRDWIQEWQPTLEYSRRQMIKDK
jgi:hypothetical protein